MGINKLTVKQVEHATKPGKYSDGGNLYLSVQKNGGRSWVFRYRRDGKLRDLGLGPVHSVTLAAARKKADEQRKLLGSNQNPHEAKLAAKADAKLAAAARMTFRECAEAYIAAHRPGWKNEKHSAQWSSTLATYVYPTIGEVAVGRIDTPLVQKALEPIWRDKTETASRVRGRIEAVLDWSATMGYRKAGDSNPARWKGHLANLFAAKSKVASVEHHAALPHRDVAGFVRTLRSREGLSARALELLILTATRTSEVLGARWEEIDLERSIWVVPAERMKAGREHRVPLSSPAVALLQTLSKTATSDFVFPSTKPNQRLSNMVLLQLLKRMKVTNITPHGFRSTFRDYCADLTDTSTEVAEMALAHTIGNKVEAAYRRGDLFEKRKGLMEAWAAYCEAVPAKSAGDYSFATHPPGQPTAESAAVSRG